MSVSSRENSSTGSSNLNRPDPVTEVDRLEQLVRLYDRSLTSARLDLNRYLRHHFYSTAEVSQLLGMSDRLVQALAAESPTMVHGFRAVRYGKLWLLKADVDRWINDRGSAPR